MTLGMLLEKGMAEPQMATAHSDRALQIAESRIPGNSDFLKAAALLLPAIPPHSGWICVFSYSFNL